MTPSVSSITLTAAIVDDEELARGYLRELLGRHPEIRIVAEYSRDLCRHDLEPREKTCRSAQRARGMLQFICELFDLAQDLRRHGRPLSLATGRVQAARRIQQYAKRIAQAGDGVLELVDG